MYANKNKQVCNWNYKSVKHQLTNLISLNLSTIKISLVLESKSSQMNSFHFFKKEIKRLEIKTNQIEKENQQLYDNFKQTLTESIQRVLSNQEI